MRPRCNAWVDESIQSAGRFLVDGIYILAATVGDPGECDPIRDQLRNLRLGNARRLHWSHEGDKQQRRIVEVIASLDVLHTVVVGVQIDPRRSERARRRCMERLFFELGRLGVERVWVERRHESLNRRDRRMIDAMRQTRAMPTSMVVEFVAPEDEPMLWIPDAVAGVVGGARKYGAGHRLLLSAAIEEIEIPLS